MSYAEWKLYWKSLKWNRKWFPLLILLRPVIDNFYAIKQYSVYLSPVNIAGVLIPVLIFWSSRKLKRRIKPDQIDEFIRVWGGFILLNCIILLTLRFSIDNLGNSIQYFTTPLLFFYCRKFIRSKQDLFFLLTTFLYSCIIPLMMLSFETFVHPIDPSHLSEGRGGGTRLRGQYGDSMSYAIYFIGAFLVGSYFYIEQSGTSKTRIKNMGLKYIALITVTLYGVIEIRQVSTWFVYATVLVLFLFYNSAKIKGFIIGALLVTMMLPLVAIPLYQKEIAPLLQKEINVVNGDSEVEFAFNGRVSRWEKYFAIWDQMPAFSKILGTPTSNFKEASVMISAGMHNDYIRQMFLSGIIGVVIYIIAMLLILRRFKFFRAPEKFLIMSSVAIIMLYSVSTLPTLYIALLNLIIPVFSFAVLPPSKAYAVSLPAKKNMRIPEHLRTA